jgi:hypothetical protein
MDAKVFLSTHALPFVASPGFSLILGRTAIRNGKPAGVVILVSRAVRLARIEPGRRGATRMDEDKPQ